VLRGESGPEAPPPWHRRLERYPSALWRIAEGSVYWRLGQTKIEGFQITDSTFFLFREEYTVPLLPPEVAAYLATIAENTLSVLLIVGLVSRLSAAGLLAMTAVIQLFVFPSDWPDHSLCATALLVVITRGPGIVSLDHCLVRARSDVSAARARAVN
jgi:putative oxidoreductase